MTIAVIQNLLRSHAAKRKPIQEEQNIVQVSERDWVVLRVSPEIFARAELLADVLAFPVQIRYDTKGSADRMIKGVVHEVRKFDFNTYLVKVEYAPGETDLLSSDRMLEIRVGEGLYFRRREEKSKGFSFPGVVECFTLFDTFRGGRYQTLRLKLHILAYMMRADGKVHEKEINVIRKFIYAQKDIRPDDREMLLYYVSYCYLTDAAFEETVKRLHTIPVEELKEVFSTALAVAEADGVVAPEEQTFYDQVLKVLAA